MKTDCFQTDESGQFYSVRDIDPAMAALRAELAEVLSAAAALRVAGEAARDAQGAELAALRADLAAMTERAERAEAHGLAMVEMASRFHRLNTTRRYAARRVAAYCRELRKRKVVSINKFELPPLEIDYGGVE